IALSTTSVAVVYAVMIETGHSTTAMGKMILAACFITDFGTVLALGVLFASFNWWMLLFVGVMCIMLWYMPRWTNFIIVRMGASHQISEPEVKFLLLILFFLGGLSTTARSEAVLPAYLVGLVVAGVFMRDKTLVHRMRSIAFAIFTPFYFLKAGLYVSLPAVWSAIGVIIFLFVLKVGAKYISVFPFARMFSMRNKESHYTSLLMGTGLTFGTIASLYGLNNHIIDSKQYTILVTVVILSAVLPTLLAQKYFKPKPSTMDAWGRLRKKKNGTKY
ncbi:MAG: cation:proton antiporter, partial [Chitinophaga rupis]